MNSQSWRRHCCSPVDLHTHARSVTLTFDILTSELVHAERLLWTWIWC